MTEHEVAIKYIMENYLNFNWLRHDIVADKLQIGLLGDRAKKISRRRTGTNIFNSKSTQKHEEIILEVSDFRAGTEYGYNHPCERELQQYEIDARRAE